jgi:type IV secretion system protein VirD4
MFTMVVNRLTERMVFEGAEQKKNRHRLLLLIDEFPSLNRMEIFADALSYMAGYGLKAYLITQDIRQIVDLYEGPNLTVEQVRASMDSEDFDPLKAFSSACRAELLKIAPAFAS